MKVALKKTLLVVWFPLTILFIWEIAAARFPNAFFVRPSEIATTASEIVSSSWLVESLLPTLALVLGGYLLGTAAGVFFGALIGSHPLSLSVLGPVAVFVRSTPSAAIIPVVLAVFGIGLTSLYVAVAVAVGFQMVLITMLAVARTDIATLEAAQVMKLGRLVTTVKIRLPAATADLLTALHVGIQTAVLVAITVEILAGGSGLGRFVVEALNAFRIPSLWVGVLVVGLVGVVFHEIFLKLERRLVPWYFAVKSP